MLRDSATRAARAFTFAIAFLLRPPLSCAADAGAIDTPPGTAGRLVEHFHMQRVAQEGPWFSLSYLSSERVDGAALAARYAGRAHAIGSAIYAVETPADFSAMHRLLTDEIWHFYGGTPVEMLLLYPDGRGRKVIIGPDVLAGQLPQFTVPQGVWQGSAPMGSAVDTYSLVGTQLSPGFDYADFEIGYRDALQDRYPEFKQDIERLTRVQFAHSAPTAVLASQPESATGTVFNSSDIAAVSAAAGVSFRELVGRSSTGAQSTAVSVAQFTVRSGTSLATSFNREAEEILLVMKGIGRLTLGQKQMRLVPGSVVFIPAGRGHAVAAGHRGPLQFLAICSPAFAPQDYVIVK